MRAQSAAARAIPEGALPFAPDGERFAWTAARERWPDFLPLEHETLPVPVGFAREESFFVVVRRPPRGRPIRDGRVPRELVPQLLLQAACAISFFQAHGFGLNEEDLADASWERDGGTARLWLAHSPAALSGARPSGAGAALSAFLDRLARRGGRLPDGDVRALAERLEATETPLRRPEFMVAATFRSFPSLSASDAAPARRRSAGYAGEFLRDLGSRALLESARAILENREARLFLPGSPLRPAGALAIDPPPSSAAEASRRLRELAESQSRRGRAVWIAAGVETWDPVSRRAFEAAARFLPPEVEMRQVPSRVAAPSLPDEWRREVYVPCGNIAAALRFYEWLAQAAREEPEGARELALDCLASAQWAAFAADATGQAPLPDSGSGVAGMAGTQPDLTASEQEVATFLAARDGAADSPEIARFCGRAARGTLPRLQRLGLLEQAPSGWRLTARGRRSALPSEAAAVLCRRWAEREADPGRKVELLLRAGASGPAIEAAERWYRESPTAPAEAWFALAARFSAAGVEKPPWLDLVEAERELAAGRPEEARAILERVAQSSSAPVEHRRAAQLREAEVCARLLGASEAGRRAATWRSAFEGAPANEKIRALRLEAGGLAREGRQESALQRLDEADRLASGMGEAAQIDNALARGSVLSLAGRFSEEALLYERWWPVALRLGDDALAARFASQEALGLCDRRDFSAAAARLEEALAVLRDDPAERARLSIDLAATLYHAGRPARCGALLEEAAALAASAGRRDLLRIARSNQIELWVARAEWDPASSAIEKMLGAAEEQGDDVWLLVALHHRSRVALRRGMLERAAQDNARAREIATRLGDRLEIGELWLEEGDRRLYERDIEGARCAWERAAADPPDRCATERLAAQRLGELSRSGGSGPSPAERQALTAGLSRLDYEAAETAARWHILFDGAGGEGDVSSRAERLLRERGGEALADRVFGRRESGPAAGSIPLGSLRTLREALARALSGDDSAAELEEAGIAGLLLADAQGRDVLRIGRRIDGEARVHLLEAGAVRYQLTLPLEVSEELGAAAALLAETLLFRPPAAPTSEGFAQGWRRFGLVTEDPSMEEPYRRLTRFAAQPVTVLVHGESGSGKEAVARAVHALSPRSAGPFVAVNVPAIPAALLESELFGHVRGAFTGAERDRLGLLEEAARGSIFFDEIGDLAPPLQSKLLRALQDREIRRVGENRSRRIDVRVVSATSRDLAREVEAGRFREDLYYRLHVAIIALPPLRERGRDALRLARHFLEAFGREYRRGPLRLSPEAALALSVHRWPGNVRELQNAMAQAAALADSDGLVGLAHLPEALRSLRPRGPSESYRSRLDAHRRGMISDALQRAAGNRSLAARELGLSRQALRYLMRELHVGVPERAGEGRREG